MSGPSSRDHWIAYAVIGALVTLAAGFAATWLYLQYKERLNLEERYLTLPRVAISRDGHSMAATVALKTSAEDAGWVADNKQVLQQMAQRVLMEADPQRVLAPGGLLTLQQTLREAGNLALQTTSVREVLLTDFLLSEGDL